MQLIELSLHLPAFAGALLLMGITTLVGLSVYMLAYRLLGNSPRRDARHAASYLFRAIG